MGYHVVRVGAMGIVGRFTAVDAVRYPRTARVIVRTGRGLELGEVLSPPGEQEAGLMRERGRPDQPSGDGSILRGMTAQDHLLAARIEKNRLEAYEACAGRLSELQVPTTLVDVEHLFDGRTLLFYFLGEVTPELAALTEELAEIYESQVQFRKFTETLTEGCGPGCGTEQAEGGCKSCNTGCAVAEVCGARR